MIALNKKANVNFLKLALSIIACELAGIVGSIFTFPSIATWYILLQKPAFNPPNWIFAPVWTTLFFLMGISLYLILEKTKENKKAKTAVSLFCLQLSLNVLWSIIFFGLRQPLYAFIEIIILWISIAATIFAFLKISKKAAYLLFPYILWVTIAAFLNYSIMVLNP